MQDTALYQYLLGLHSPLTLSRFKLNVSGKRVDMRAEHSENATRACSHRKLSNRDDSSKGDP